MTKRMLIDSTHAEETRVVVLDGNRLEDYDVETSTKQQLKGNIYLAKIVRVEPSLQAAFVEFGGGRHGFLAFGEIHPDYYQIPVADRKRLLEMQEAEAREEEEQEEREAARQERNGAHHPQNAPTGIQVPDELGEDAQSVPADEPAAADALTEQGYAIQADPSGTSGDAFPEAMSDPALDVSADMPMPRADQVALPAAIAQEIIVVPEEAQALFPASEGTDLAPEAPQGESQAASAVPLEAIAADAVLQADQGEPPASADPDHNDAQRHGPSDAASTVEDLPAPAPPDQADEQPDDAADTSLVQASGPAEDVSRSIMDVLPPDAAPEHIGGELDVDDRPDRRQPSRFLRNYKIQEVIRRRQILLVQVVKEERGTKGAALTTYISLAGRFSVLMPNSPRGGGISRKITSAADRRRLKEITAELDLPRGMGLIVRTAGAARPKPEILRDCEYLLNQWDQIRDFTMRSMAPALIYEEASLIKRAIRDVYSRDVEEILVDGDEGWRAARDFMRMLMPAHAKKVQLWRDPQPLFAKAQVESQLDSMLQPTVQLRSGGYLVINQTEALVAIDVNSGRSTRERGIEETALRTNMEAAEEAARQLRLRDLAGLIVIDFIDMESRRNNASVEKKLKDALKNDRARIQVGSISHFGLLEMSRQRLRPSLAETSFVPCPHCGGTGHMRNTESAALAVLRGIEDEGGKRRAAEIVVHVHGSIALYILNHKRVRLGEIEQRFGLHVTFHADDSMIPPQMRIEKIRALLPSEVPMPASPLPAPDAIEDPDDAVMEADDVDTEDAEVSAAEDDDDVVPGETAEEGEQRQRKRRRRRRGGRREEAQGGEAVAAPESEEALSRPVESVPEAEAAPVGETPEPAAEASEPASEALTADIEASDDASLQDAERKRRGRRGGRRRRREPDVGDAPASEAEEATAPEPSPVYIPVYTGPTPANPFGGDSNAFAFFDAVEDVDHPAPVRPAPSPEPMPTPVSVAEVMPDLVPEVGDVPASAAGTVVVPEPVAEPEPVAAPAAEMAADATHGAEPTAAAGVDVVEEVAAEPVTAALEPEPTPSGPMVGPAIIPIVIGAPDAPLLEKKRGWWRS